MRIADRIVLTALLALLGASALVVAQQPAPSGPAPAKVEAPVLSELDALKIENALLKVSAAQTQLDKLKADFQALLASLQKPGYQIAQGQDGKLSYQPEPKSVNAPKGDKEK